MPLDAWLTIGAAYLGHLFFFLRWVARLPTREEITILQHQANDPNVSPAGRAVVERLAHLERAVGGNGQPGLESLVATLGGAVVTVNEQLRAGNTRFAEESSRRHQLRDEYEKFRDLSQERFTGIRTDLAEMKAMLTQFVADSQARRKGR